MKKYISILDTERFGFKIAKFSSEIEHPVEVIKELKSDGVKLIIARVDFKEIELIKILEDIGFRYKDAQVTFSYNLAEELPRHSSQEIILTEFNSTHFARMLEMTKNSFYQYGHYFADKRLDENKCLEIYTDWIRRCCDSIEVADNIIVAEVENEAIGYLAMKTQEKDDNKYIAGVIGAVAPEYRKMGVFKEINIESLYLAKRLGITRVENNVLVTNYPVMKTYTSLKYTIIRSELTLHYWNG